MLLCLAVGCAAPREIGDAPRSDPSFVDVTVELGLAEPGGSWPDGSWLMPEIMGPGVGMLDHDGDGDLDLIRLRVPPPGSGAPAPNVLWQQQPDGSFRDVTHAAGLGDPGWGQGVAVGDVNDDGWADVFFANYDADALYLNRGDGTFARADLPVSAERGWSSSAAFCDYDADGDLDLYVARYVRVDHAGHCPNKAGAPDYCGPATFDGEPDRLYRNRGGGRFEDVTQAAGLDLPDPARGKGLVAQASPLKPLSGPKTGYPLELVG